MVRQALLATLSFTALAGSVSAQMGVIEVESPIAVQQQSPYFKTLTNAREEDLEEKRELEKDVLVDAAVNRVAGAFFIGDADELEACLVTGKRRIFLGLDSNDAQQTHYGPGQVRHIFARLFREVETRSFLYDLEKVEYRSGGAVFNADWTYAVVDTDEEYTERLAFKLEKGETAWRVYDIRTVAR